jgi:hypothetical protein
MVNIDKQKLYDGIIGITDIDVVSILGLDYEPSDRDVGIFSASFCIGIKDKNGKEYNLYLGDEQFSHLLDIIKPYKSHNDF